VTPVTKGRIDGGKDIYSHRKANRFRFEEQANQKKQGDDEAQLIDENFCTSLEVNGCHDRQVVGKC
jgi:hypothetical protein